MARRPLASQDEAPKELFLVIPAGGKSASCFFIGDLLHPVRNMPIERAWGLRRIDAKRQALKDRHAIYSTKAIGCQCIDPLANDLCCLC